MLLNAYAKRNVNKLNMTFFDISYSYCKQCLCNGVRIEGDKEHLIIEPD